VPCSRLRRHGRRLGLRMQRPVASFAVWLVAAIWLHDASAQPPERLAGEGLVPEKSFLPQPGRGAPRSLSTVPSCWQRPQCPLNRQPFIRLFRSTEILAFPGCAPDLRNTRAELVPESEDVQRIGSARQGRSYWDIIVQPGQVWSQSNERGWSRATFPFALVNSFENETHNGVATFRYRHGEVSRAAIPDHRADPSLRGGHCLHRTRYDTGALRAARRGQRRQGTSIYHLEKRDAIPFADWKSLSALLGRAAPALDPDIRPSSYC